MARNEYEEPDERAERRERRRIRMSLWGLKLKHWVLSLVRYGGLGLMLVGGVDLLWPFVLAALRPDTYASVVAVAPREVLGLAAILDVGLIALGMVVVAVSTRR
jgi:hypothetical protein